MPFAGMGQEPVERQRKILHRAGRRGAGHWQPPALASIGDATPTFQFHG
jgi:hypothetical protein